MPSTREIKHDLKLLNTPSGCCVQALVGFTMLLRSSKKIKTPQGIAGTSIGTALIVDLLLNHRLLEQTATGLAKLRHVLKTRTNVLQVEDEIIINRSKTDTLKHVLNWRNWEHLHKNCEINAITSEGHVYFVLKNISQKDLSCSLEVSQFNDRFSWNALPGSRSRLSGWMRVIESDQPNQSKLAVRLTFHRSEDLMEYAKLLLQKDKIRAILRKSLLQIKEDNESSKFKLEEEERNPMLAHDYVATTPEQLPVMEDDGNPMNSPRILH